MAVTQQFSIEVEVSQLMNDTNYEKLQLIVNYIIGDELPLEIIAQFVYALNWSEETFLVGEMAASLMSNIQACQAKKMEEV